jgi:uncharacterized Fe-S center protein
MVMSAPTVYFLPPERAVTGIGTMLEASGFLGRLKPKKRIGIKVHFGEQGNSSHLRPELIRAAAIACSHHNLQPAAIETTALYRGRRQLALDHLELAREHGFTTESLLAPIEILDGRQGERFYAVPLDSTLVPEAKLAHGLRRISYVINLAHFKGHFVTGFGGVIKNLAMGLAAKAGKLEMHSGSRPFVDPEKCVSCGVCVDYCPHEAINFVQYVAKIGRSCSGCGGCLPVCRQAAIRINWDAAPQTVQLKMVEYCRAVVQGRELFHVNACLRITPNCDCYPQTENPVMADVGVFGSLDPVACEQAAWDRAGPALTELYPHLKPDTILAAAEERGLGRREHRVENL